MPLEKRVVDGEILVAFDPLTLNMARHAIDQQQRKAVRNHRHDPTLDSGGSTTS